MARVGIRFVHCHLDEGTLKTIGSSLSIDIPKEWDLELSVNQLKGNNHLAFNTEALGSDYRKLLYTDITSRRFTYLEPKGEEGFRAFFVDTNTFRGNSNMPMKYVIYNNDGLSDSFGYSCYQTGLIDPDASAPDSDGRLSLLGSNAKTVFDVVKEKAPASFNKDGYVYYSMLGIACPMENQHGEAVCTVNVNGESDVEVKGKQAENLRDLFAQDGVRAIRPVAMERGYYTDHISCSYRAALPDTITCFYSANSNRYIDPAATPNYTVNANYDANNCEFYVDAFEEGYFSGGPAHTRWIDASFKINEADLMIRQGNTILNSGMYVKLSGGGEKYVFGSPASFDIEARVTSSTGESTIAYTPVDAVAFFLDLRRPNGEVGRLWISNGGKNFTLAQIFDGYPFQESVLGGER